MLSRLSPVALGAIGVLLLSAMDATIKHLSASNGVLAIAFGRYLFGAFAAFAIWRGAGAPRIDAEMLRAHFFRCVLIVIVAVTFFYSLSVLPLAEAITLAFVAPLLVPFFAWAVAGERPRTPSLAAVGVGFIGAVVALQGAPPADENPARLNGVIAVLISAAAYAWALALLRTRADKDGAPSVGLLQTAIPCLLVAGPAIALSPMPATAELPWFALMGLLGAGGWYLLIIAYSRAQAQVLAPLDFTGLIWASAFGYFLFDEIPRTQLFLGAAMIVVACLYAAWDERRSAPGPQIPIGD
jgi:S-adenosylmethionine uptake transporter